MSSIHAFTSLKVEELTLKNVITINQNAMVKNF